MIDEWAIEMDERLKKFEYELVATNSGQTKESFRKWKRYWKNKESGNKHLKLLEK